jgi:hypothetical protein
MSVSDDDLVQIAWPDGFDEFAWEVQAKGYLREVVVTTHGRRYSLDFYDNVRLAQDVEEDLALQHIAVLTNVIVVPLVTRQAIEAAVSAEESRNGFAGFVALNPDEEGGLGQI